MVQKAIENGCFLRFQGAKCSVVNVFEGRNFETFLCLSGFWAINVKFGYAFGLIILRKASGHSGLFQANDAYDECDSMYFRIRQFKWVVLFVVGDDEYVLLVGSWFYALDEWSLCGVEHIGFVPLEE